METSQNKTKKDGHTTTTSKETGQNQDNDGKDFNPFARASKIGRTPPKGPRPRVDSCPELKIPLSNLRGTEDKRKRSEVKSPPTSTAVAAMVTEKETGIGGNDEVFVVEGSPSPESSREIKKRKEQGPSSFKTTWDELEEPAELTAISSGLRQMAEKMEKMAGDLSFETKKHVNTKVEIKKLARDLDVMSQNLSRKVSKFCNVVGRKLRKSKDGEEPPDSEASQGKGVTVQDVACQTDPPPRKQKEGALLVTRAATDEEMKSAANGKWQEGWFLATTLRVGNPWNSPPEEDLAIMVTEEEATMETGIARLLTDRFPEVEKIAGSGTLRVTSTVQVGTEDPVTRNRAVHKVSLAGLTDADVLDAIKKLAQMASGGSGVLSIPAPNGMDELRLRKLADLVFRKGETRLVIHTPHRKGGKPIQTPADPEAGNKPKRVKDTEVLLVKQGEKSYVDMVKGLREMVGKQEVKGLMQVRKSQDGRLLLAFKKGESEVEGIKCRIQSAWEGAVVTGGGGATKKCTFHIKDLDAGVEDEELWEAIHKMAPTLRREEVEFGVRRPMFGGNLAVTLRIENRLAHQLRGSKKVKIGLNTCRMEERVELQKCFRCWNFGHIARQCRGPDRRNLCTGCGKEGHVVANCRNAPFCVLCDAGGHRGGSGSCPRFRAALQEERRTSREKEATRPQTQGDEVLPLTDR